MKPLALEAVSVRAQIERWPLVRPFRITGYSWEAIQVLVVTLEKGGCIGRGEAAGVYYKDDTPESMSKHIEKIRGVIEAEVSRDSLENLLPPCGARNAVDCALWELEAKLSGCAAWQLAQFTKPRRLLTTFTCGADEPEKMVAAARGYPQARAIKLKLTGEPIDAARVMAVREAMPDIWLGVDGNQGFNRSTLTKLLPVLVEAQIALIEQPFPIGHEGMLDGLRSPISIAADESVQGLADLRPLAGRVDMVNIKLDKCGGLTEGLKMVLAARELGLDTMVGNMMGTSLSIAPAFLLGQLCKVVDLDGPALLRLDRADAVEYSDGLVACPESLWGGISS